MSAPTTREGFTDYCLRKLGAPVVEINVDDDQVSDRVDEALQYYNEYHYDGVERIYLKHQITQDDIDNGSIPLSDLIIGVRNIFPVTGDNTASSGSSGLFNLQYQLRLNDLYDLTNTSIVYYSTVRDYIATLDLMLNGTKPLRFNKHQNRLSIDMNWAQSVVVGQYLIVDCYRALDPVTWTDVWNDMWLKRYATALIKKQWATNIKKFSGIALPGGVTLDGDKLYAEATEEIHALEDQMQTNYSLPPDFMLG
jgi:hypothetical protein